MLFHSAQFGLANERLAVLFRESQRDLDFQGDGLDHARDRAVIYALDDADALSREIPFPAKAKDVDSGTCSNGRQEQLEG